MFTTGSIPPPGPLSYEGQVVVPFINRNDDPSTAFNKFPVPTVWVNTTSDSAWILVSKRLGVAQWIPIGGGALAVQQFTLPGGNVILPSAFNINLLNGSGISITGPNLSDDITISTAGTVAQSITTPDAVVVAPTAGNWNFLNGTGMNITGSGSNVTFNGTGGALTWTVITAASQAMDKNNGYVANRVGGVAFSLPTTAAVGDVVGITTIQATGWTLSQAAGQSVRLGNQVTTSGVTGSLASNAIGDTVILLCVVANTTFVAISYVGNITLA